MTGQDSLLLVARVVQNNVDTASHSYLQTGNRIFFLYLLVLAYQLTLTTIETCLNCFGTPSSDAKKNKKTDDKTTQEILQLCNFS